MVAFVKSLPFQEHRHLSLAERGYIAAMIDGEGSIFLCRRKKRYRSEYWELVLQVANTDHRVMEWLIVRLGGHISWTRPGTGGHKPTYYWRARQLDVAKVLRRVKRFLVIKGEQAEIALTYSKTFSTAPGRRGHSRRVIELRRVLSREMKCLNRGKEMVADGTCS